MRNRHKVHSSACGSHTYCNYQHRTLIKVM